MSGGCGNGEGHAKNHHNNRHNKTMVLINCITLVPFLLHLSLVQFFITYFAHLQPH